MKSCTALAAAALVMALTSEPALAEGCRDIGRINQSIQAAKLQLDAAVAYDGPRREVGRVCQLSRQIDQGVKRMYAIIQADPQRCGRSPAAVRGLADAVARSALQKTCPYAG